MNTVAGHGADMGIHVHDMLWSVDIGNGEKIKPIGFGFPLNIQPYQILMFAMLTDQMPMDSSIHPLNGGQQPLFNLIFVVPNGAEKVLLFSATGNEYTLSISSEWEPTVENGIAVFTFSGDEEGGPKFIWQTDAEGNNWKTSP